MVRRTRAAGQKSKTVEKRNQQILKSLIVKAVGDEESKSISNDDEFTSVQNVIPPPYDLNHLCMLRENSTELEQCIDAMVTNIDGFGYRLVSRFKTTKEAEKYKDEVEKEKAKIEMFLDNINFDEDITSLREETRRDWEDCGNAYWEIIPNLSRTGISSIERIRPQTVRLLKQDKTAQRVDMPVYNTHTQNIVNRVVKRRFRRFVQGANISQQKVYFKEWGDPREVDAKTGNYLRTATEINAAKKKGNLANAMIHFKISSNRTPYGIPRYIGNLFSIHGSRAADEINYVTFTNNNIPSMIFMVSNGQLTDDSITRMEEFIKTKVANTDNRSSFLIVEAEPSDEGQINPGTMKMEAKDISGAQKDDQLFQKYDHNNGEKIRRCFRMPQIFVGKSEDYNRATAQESRKLTDEQVFAPKRRNFDRTMNQLLISAFNMKYHIFQSNSANVTNDQDIVKILSSAEKTGGVTPNLARMMLGDIFNTHIPPYNVNEVDFDPDVPMSITIVDRAKSVAGSPSTGKLAPNQGQIPKGETATDDDETTDDDDVETTTKQIAVVKILRDQLTDEIYNEVFGDLI